MLNDRDYSLTDDAFRVEELEQELKEIKSGKIYIIIHQESGIIHDIIVVTGNIDAAYAALAGSLREIGEVPKHAPSGKELCAAVAEAARNRSDGSETWSLIETNMQNEWTVLV